ncbi:hypothetical protein CK203_044033 [Vitis vinifera]|uniref:Retrovirus-related Pol polyprotein from transposon TNT 1-94 n=1 Tax=Vitis vinifera TaxID=29760 RepID=A0A438HM30_VITVI|nr:hypothetical protein CK203_044033 [Vitis vinifera]
MLSKIVGLTIASWRFGTLEREPILQHFTLIVLELRTEIQSIKKDGLIPDEYVVKVENVVDKLGSIGEPVLDKDQLIYLFQGLGAEYNPFRQNVVEQLNVNMTQAKLAVFANKKPFKIN